MAFLRNASDGIHILDFEGNVIEASDAFCAMLDYRRDEILGMNISQWDVPFFGQKLSKGFIEQFDKPIRSQIESLYRCKNGTLLDVEISTFPLELDGKQVLFKSSRDITERKLTQQMILDKEIAEQTWVGQRQFIAMVSHEFRSPLALIGAAAQLLSVKAAQDPDIVSIVANIYRGVMRLSGFLDNCLTEDRLNSQGLALEITAINLHELARLVKDSATRLSGKHQIIIEVDSNLTTIDADPQLLRILLLNLLGNAIKYSPKGSKVTLYIISNGLSCIFKVSDQGQGIPAEELTLVFNKYMRGNNVSNTPGAGLGLTLVKNIVELHNGGIEISSCVNIGTCVTVTLPLKSAANHSRIGIS